MAEEKKRKLSKNEIEEILSFIVPEKGVPKLTAKSIVDINKNHFRSQLESVLVYPEIIPELKRELCKIYMKSIIEPGESIGVIMAQSIGEKRTQSNLNTFHKAGSGKMEGDSSRFKELLDATKNPKRKSAFVYFKTDNKTVTELRESIGSSIVQINVARIAKNITISTNKEEEVWYSLFFLSHDVKNTYKDCIEIDIDMDLLYTYKLSLKEVAKKIENEYSDLLCVYSPDCFGRLDIFFDTNDIELPEEILFVTQENRIDIYLEEVGLPDLKNINVAGIEGIEEIFFMKDPESENWIVETQGDNFVEIMAHENVDTVNTYTSSIWEIYNTLGIEAVREFLIEQFLMCMPGINISHIKLLVDKMTYRGTIESISRFASEKGDNSVFGKASFEETLKIFLNAGLYGKNDPVTGVSASIICGKCPQLGTGSFDLVMDLNKINENE